jgi:glyoxylase-like metal-dependent hydrolase (beta-lactamase superfamily II)
MEVWKIGDVEITRVVDVVQAFPATGLIPQATPEALRDLQDWLCPDFADSQGNLQLSIHAFAIRSGDARIVVDTCIGDKQRPLGMSALKSTFLEDLNGIGFARAAVDRVLCTHLHFDHIGWNTILENGRWAPTFPNARYLVGETEWGFWKHEDDPYAPEAKADSLLPIFEADLVDLVEPRHAVTDEVRLIPSPGHTPGHVCVMIESRGEQAIITGDLFHSPLQMAHPDWTNSADVDAALAFETRQNFLARYADSPVLILGTHFASPTAGHIVRDGDTFRFAT